eukprot:7786424-Alexandrium_andersonii.AAC.1
MAQKAVLGPCEAVQGYGRMGTPPPLEATGRWAALGACEVGQHLLQVLGSTGPGGSPNARWC